MPGFCSSYPQTPGAGRWQSSRVFYDSSGRLTYATDGERNRIPDYSYAGYRYGQVAIPSVPEVLRLAPASGDNTSRIQQALDQVGARSPDANGIRGAVVLGPGTYEIRGTLRVNRSGVVLRGSGDGGSASSDPILRATGDTPHQRPVVVLGSGDANWTESSTRANVTTPFVAVNARSLGVSTTSGFATGDYVVVHHPSTRAWIDAVDGGGMVDDPPWNAGQIDIVYYRRIAGISGTTVTLDVPLYNHLDRALSQAYLAKVSSNSITQAGVESLRIVRGRRPEPGDHRPGDPRLHRRPRAFRAHPGTRQQRQHLEQRHRGGDLGPGLAGTPSSRERPLPRRLLKKGAEEENR